MPSSLLKLALLGSLALFCVIILTGLGIWQIERRTWKLELIDHVQQRIHAAAVSAPEPAMWADISADDAYRHVRVEGHFLDNRDTLVKAVTNRGDGFWVIAPLQTAEGFIVLVNRGFVPSETVRNGWKPDAQAGAMTSLTGLLRLTEPGGAFLRSNDPVADRWYSRDVGAIAAARNIAQVAPYFIDADANANTDKLPIGGLTIIAFPNNHLVYALTWFAMAILLAGASVFVLRSEWRRRTASTSARDVARVERATSQPVKTTQDAARTIC
ncbi:SURF1 family protein (plasmid) [Phyllobacterium sp. 628]|nr:SURF1 family protein [Phyllobacterium sp. 628]